MASITFAVDKELKAKIAKLVWIVWSELVRQELLKQEKTREAFEKFKKIVAKSKFTEKDAKELADKVNSSMHEELKIQELA